jgi:hypothetical protein
MKAIAHKFFQDQANPIDGKKDGEYLPGSVAREYPWQVVDRLDEFRLESRTTDNRYGAISILDLMSQKTRFHNKIRRSARGKTPGKDDIPNELLRNLPDGLLEAIHNLFILMYITAINPKDWKVSLTVLLYKKNCPLDL